MIRQNENIDGINILYEEILLSQCTDDTTFSLDGTTFSLDDTTFSLDDTTFSLDGTTFSLDDTTFSLDGTRESFCSCMCDLQQFASVSGLNINVDKTKAVWIGSR